MSEEKEMKETKKDQLECCQPKKWHHHNHGFEGIYFFAMIGAAVYFVGQVHGFWPIVFAILKAFVWPAFLIHKVFTMLHM